MLVMLTGLFAFSANAQTYPTNTPPAGPYFMGEEATYTFEANGFDAGTLFFLWYDLDGDGVLDEDEVLGSSSTQDAEVDLTYDWPIVAGGTVTELYRLGAYSGNIFQDNALTLDESDFGRTVVGTNNTGFDYGFSRAGVRYYETDELDLSTTEAKTLSIRLDDNGLDIDNPINVEFSTDGGATFTAMVVATASVDVALEGETDLFGFVDNQTFTFDIPVDDDATILRVSQVDANGLGAFEKTWDLNDFEIFIGDVYTVVNFANNSFETLNEISVDVFEVADASDNPVFTVYPGDEDVKIRATIDDIDLANYEFAGYIENQTSGQIYLLENQTSNEDGALDEITITGDIPVDLVYNENWNAFVVAYSGASPTFGTNIFAPAASLDSDDDVESTSGYNTTDNDFDGDEERSFTTVPFNIQSVDDGIAWIDLSRTSSGLAADGTDIVLEYSTDGTAFTQVGDEVSLNADLSETLEFDLSAETDLISSATQFRVRQLANSGLELDTWAATLTVSLGGNILADNADGGFFDYTSDVIFIAEPVIVLDPVNVPDDLIFPGDELTLVYNITNGAFPEGTMIHAELTFGQDYILGTSTEIVPGDDADNEIDITVPPIPGGDYNVSLESMTGSTSNSVSLPIYETTVTITSVDSDNGIFDGTVDVIYPGDNVTVNYDLEGSVGAGAELFLEYYDYDLDEFVELTSTQTLSGSIDGTLPSDVNLNDGGNARLRIRIGNGSLASSTIFTVDNDEGFSMNATFDGPSIFNYYQEELTLGNDPTDLNDFIGSGERSSTTIAGPAPFGGQFWIWFDGESYDEQVGPQTVTISASNDGTNFVTIAEFDYEGQSDYQFGNNFDNEEPAIDLPESVWGEEVVFRFSYNADGAAGEFENVLELDAIVLQAYGTVAANSSEFDITASGQFRNFTISLEEINDPVTYVVGEEVTIEYTTEGTFPAETGFALIFEGDLDAGDGATGGYDDGEEFFTVVATSTDQGSGSFTFNVPDMAFEFDGTDSNFDLYDRLTVVAFDGTGGAGFLPNELIIVDSDEQFLVLGGTDEEDGSYTFDLAGDRSALTIAFDISTVQSANLNFTYNSGIAADDNILTIPQLQYSIDAGATFVNIEVEDSGLEGGYLVGSQAYSVMVPAEAITAATHFRWVQDLNLGEFQDTWSISGISVELINGNEIMSAYDIVNDDQTISVAHPSTGDYELSQVDPDDAIFNGETAGLTFDAIFETSDAFPANTTFDYLLYDPSIGGYVIDPETNDPLVVGTSSAAGAFTATIPFFVENGSYEIRLVASKTGAEEPYFYVGAENDGLNIGTIEVFLRVLSTTVDFDAADVLYAGSTVTVNVDLENDETNTIGVDDLFATLCIENFSGGDDLILATQQGIADFTVDLPPYLRGGDFDFIVKLSEISLGEPCDLIGDADELTNLEQDVDNFINQPQLAAIITTPVFNGSSSVTETINYTIDYDTDDNNTLQLQYNLNNNGWTPWINIAFGDASFSQSFNFNRSDGETVQFRWVIFADEDGLDGNTLEVTGVSYGSTSIDDSELSPMSMIESGVLAFTNDFGRGLITTREFEAGELANSTLVSFDLTFPKLAEEITADQFLIFEYSVDGGDSFSEIATFPDADDEMTINDETFLFNLGDLANDVGANASIFRFRQEERNDINVMIDNFSFLSGETLPFDYVSDNQTIAPQVILVTGISSEESCLDEEIVLDYEIRGSFGADVELFVGYEIIGGETGVFADPITGIVSGTGSLAGFVLPPTLFLEADNNQHFRFSINYDDETFEEELNIEYSSDTEQASENSVEVVAPVDPDANFSVSDVTECSGDEVMVFVSNPQDFFMYEILDAADGTVLGTLMYDPEEGDNEINLGVLPLGLTDLELQITSMSSTGTTCNTLISTDEEDVEVLENFALYFDDNETSNFAPIADGSAFTFCEGSGNGGRLAAYRALADGSGISQNSTVEWYLDDINSAPISTESILNFSSLDNSGTYFALVFDGDCSYVTTSVDVTIPESPDQPVITVVSGELIACEDADPIVLSAPDGFTYYSWSNGENSQTIEIESSTTISVSVSNVPFTQDGNCGSATSDALEIERFNNLDFNISTSTSFNDQIIEGEVIEVCNGQTVYFFDNNVFVNTGGVVEIVRDGSVVGTASNTTSVFLDESGVYSFNYINDDIGLTNSCTASSESFTLNVVESPEDPPVITVVSGNLIGCDDEDPVVLRGPDGFGDYLWNTGERTQQIVVDLSGNSSSNITLRVGNTVNNDLADCLSPTSSVTRVERYTAFDFNVSLSGSLEDVINEGDVIDECEDGFSVFFFDENSNTNGGGFFEIVRDGAVIGSTTGSSYFIDEGGVYSFNYLNDENTTCTSSSVEFTVNLIAIPDAPVITTTDPLAFCEGEGSVTLTVTSPATAAQYRWFRNGSEISSNTDGFGSTSSSITVTEDGDYTVQVSDFVDEETCFSPESNAIEVNVRSRPFVDASQTLAQDDVNCGEGSIVFRAESTDDNFLYQLVNESTGQVSGTAVRGSGGGNAITLVSDPVTESTNFQLMVMYADGAGCEYISTDTEFGEINNLTLEIDGNDLVANISGSYDGSEYPRWYRVTGSGNIELRNLRGDESFTLTDGSEYLVEVDFEDGCVVSVSSSTLVTPTARIEAAAGLEVNAFPNPAVEQISVNLTGGAAGDYQMSIVDMAGRVEMSSIVEKGAEDMEVSIDLTNLNNGIYNLVIRQGGKVESVRIVKQ